MSGKKEKLKLRIGCTDGNSTVLKMLVPPNYTPSRRRIGGIHAEMELHCVCNTDLFSHSKIPVFLSMTGAAYFMEYVLEPPCCAAERLLHTEFEYQVRKFINYHRNEYKDCVSKIRKQTIPGVPLYFRLKALNCNINGPCFTCGYGVSRTSFVAEKSHAECKQCRSNHWSLAEIAHRPDCWTCIYPNIYLSVPLTMTTCRTWQQTIVLFVRFNPKDPLENSETLMTYNLTGGRLRNAPSDEEGETRLFTSQMWLCPTRERVPTLMNITMTAICLHIHRVSLDTVGPDSLADYIPNVDPRLPGPGKLEKKGILMSEVLRIYIPMRIYQKLIEHYALIELHTPLTQTYRSADGKIKKIGFQRSALIDLLFYRAPSSAYSGFADSSPSSSD